MPHSLAKVVLHIVFSTKHRAPFIRPEIEKELHAYQAAICRAQGSPALIINGAEDHVHILCRLSRTIAICDLLEEVKKRSSKWIKYKGKEYKDFAWQNGYWAASVGERGIERVRRYIANQKEHHRKKSFKQEHRETLGRHGVEFDERYVWD
jgi:REP element-mobilizing transposase RayT